MKLTQGLDTIQLFMVKDYLDMEDRIKLAEAMGWRHDTVQTENPRVTWWTNGEISRTSLSGTVPPFNPFTDANDDYAVLEWMRGKGNDTILRFNKFVQAVKWQKSNLTITSGK